MKNPNDPFDQPNTICRMVNSKVLLCNTGKYIQYPIVSHNGKRIRKRVCACVYIYVCVCVNVNIYIYIHIYN